MRRSPSLRHAYLLLGTGSACLVVVLAAALVVSVVWLMVLSSDLRRTLDADRGAMDIQFDLFRAARSHEVYGESRDPFWLQDAKESEARLAASITRLRGIRMSPEATAAFERLDATVTELRRDVLDVPPQQRSIQLGDFLAADADATAFLDVIAADADATLDHAARWGRIAIILASISLLAFLIILPLVVSFTRRAVYLPIVRLRSALEAHATDRSVRAPDAGPVEVRGIAADVNALFDRLDAQREQQLTFLAGVAHDLRNPMAALRSAAQLSERRAESGPQRQQAARVLRQTDRMNRPVDDLLDVSRIEVGQFELEFAPVDLRELVRDTCDLYDGVSEDHEIRCALPASPIRVKVDSTRISQVLGNLVSNAIKYSPGGGAVDVRLATENGWAIVEVTDRGLGIPPEDRARVFEAFRRSTGAAPGIPGVGLGLSVARRLVRAHHGEIDFESTVGVGSTFRIRLPLDR